VSASKVYVLLRGRVLGRAQHSKEKQNVVEMIAGVRSLANAAAALDHLNSGKEEEEDEIIILMYSCMHV